MWLPSVIKIKRRPHGFPVDAEGSNLTARQNFFEPARKFKSCCSTQTRNPASTLLPNPYNIQDLTMKRKLNSEDVPEAVVAEGGEEQAATTSKATFASLNLDARLLQAITKEKFTEPTAVQAEALPLALSGKDILGTSSNCRKPRPQGLTISSSIQDRLWQDSRLPLPHHPLHPATKGLYDKASKGSLRADPGSHERAGISGYFNDQDLHNLLRARSPR